MARRGKSAASACPAQREFRIGLSANYLPADVRIPYSLFYERRTGLRVNFVIEYCLFPTTTNVHSVLRCCAEWCEFRTGQSANYRRHAGSAGRRSRHKRPWVLLFAEFPLLTNNVALHCSRSQYCSHTIQTHVLLNLYPNARSLIPSTYSKVLSSPVFRTEKHDYT